MVFSLDDHGNYGQACSPDGPYGHMENMRTIIRAVTVDFREMYPNRERNFCCGGGSAVLFDDPEMYQKRIQFSQTKANQIQATGVGKNGKGILCAPCSICKAQFYPMVEEHELGVTVHGLINLVGKALVGK